MHCRDPFPLTVALSFWINPSVCRPIVKWLDSNGLIGNTLARDEKDLCDIGLMLCFKGRRAGDAASVTFRFRRMNL